MMLAAPPAAAITYVNDSSGLDPSVYGGGGSPSSTPLLDSASSSARASSKEGAGAVVKREPQTVSVTLALIQSSSASEGK
jgi:hypothetical protein